ncbi:MAG: VOC family protein [Proteobacteria bacterium]|nr:VOC family protein [Pseudomonadota bacterium]MBS0572796.1 VOC family protein [Pseudomonadota bacterium]
MSFSPYLHFQGNCAQAMQAYAEIFGATDLQIMRYADAPPMTGVPAAKAPDKVMHSHMTVGGQALMASDFPDHMQGEPQAAVSVSHMVADVARGRAVFDRLAEGGAVIMPFGPTFFSKGFGMVKDRFGTHWMIMGPQA